MAASKNESEFQFPIAEYDALLHDTCTENLETYRQKLKRENNLRRPAAKLFGVAVRKRRKQLGVSGRQFAGTLGLDHTCLSKWEQGLLHPTYVTVAKLARALGCDPSDLYSNHPDAPATGS